MKAIASNILKAVTSAISDMPGVQSVQDFKGVRTYINIRTIQRRNGDRSYRAYIDHATGWLIITNGKGTCSGEFVDNLRALVAAYPDMYRKAGGEIGVVRKEAFGPADEDFSFIAR